MEKTLNSLDFNERFSYFTFKIFCVLFIFYTIVYPLELNFLFKFLMLAIYCVVFVILFFQFFNKRIIKVNAFVALLCMALILLEFIFYQIKISIDTVQPIMCFVLFLLVLCVQSNFIFVPQMHKCLLRTAVIVSVVLSYYSFLPFAYYFRGTNETCRYLTLNLDNANFTGIVLFTLFSIIFMEHRKSRFKLFLYALMGYLVYMIYLTNSRTCLVTTAIVILLSSSFARGKIANFFVFLLEMVPFAFLPIYIFLSRTYSNKILLLDKRVFSGRQDIYLRYMQEIQSIGKFLFGNMKNVFFVNSGNGPFALICSTGIIVTIMFYIIHIKCLFTINNNSTTYEGKVALYILLAFCIHTCTESSMVLGGIICLFIYYVLLVIASEKRTENRFL